MKSHPRVASLVRSFWSTRLMILTSLFALVIITIDPGIQMGLASAAPTTGEPTGVSTSGPVKSVGGQTWFAVARSNGVGSVYLQSGLSWKLRGTFSLIGGVWTEGGAGGPSSHVNHTTLSGIDEPVFLFASAGADSPRLSVVADWHGKWKALPFSGATYGSVTATTMVSSASGVSGGLVETEYDPCGCAFPPSVDTWYKYANGSFSPTNPPGAPLSCALKTFDSLADQSVATYTDVACRYGWALVQDSAETGIGALALFNEQSHHWKAAGGLDDETCTKVEESSTNVGIPTAIIDVLSSSIHLKTSSGSCA